MLEVPVVLPRTIAIDGPAGSGKSTVAFLIARDLNYLFVDTGAFYRAVTLAALSRGLIGGSDDSAAAQPNEHAVASLAQRSSMRITSGLASDGRYYTFLLDGQDVTSQLRAPEVDRFVSIVSAMPAVRDALTIQQRALASSGRVIMVGRDIGTVVLPDAELKIYLDASPQVRAERRYRQRIEAGEPADLNEILAGILKRDALDSGRAVSPLRRAPDAVYLLTDSLTVDEVVERLKQIILQWEPLRQQR
jgi:cytidylate kinase